MRQRRELKRKQQRRRRVVLGAILVAFVGGLALGASAGSGGHSTKAKPKRAVASAKKAKPKGPPLHAARPKDIRGVHVTMALASLPGKIAQYASISGLNTIELDVKDENGKVGFVPSSVPLAKAIGAAQPYYKPRRLVGYLHTRRIYVVGRVVTFEDPVLSEARPALAVGTADGGVWHNNAGLGWTNPYDRRVWNYNVDIAVAAAKAGFDEIQFDYVRFPSDGDISLIRYPGEHPQPMGWTIPAYAQYAAKRLRPLDVRVSVDLFGLAATRDLGIGQHPRRIAQYVDAIYPMTYPSHYNKGEYGIPDPNLAPGDTVGRSLSDYQFALQGRKARLVPWLQDFPLGRTYTLADVQAQIAAARQYSTGGFLLWNPLGVYTDGVLVP
ncbi:MAG: putative glycoside hydrolase [Actinomycetota bacterium]|nr:putative glycoside hydrolase [Actinomycetota bacterium]